MPRKSMSPFSDLQRHARKLLAGLDREIRSRRADLARLEQEFERLTGIAGVRAAVPRLKGKRSIRARINWTEVLDRLPKQFKASDIRNVRGLRNKRPSELFAAITRWIESGTVKKKVRGVYLRVEKPQAGKTKKAK